MARCPDCQKFVPNGDLEFPDGADVELNYTEVSISLRAVIPCGECGTELSEYNFEVSEEISDFEHADGCPTQIEEDTEPKDLTGDGDTEPETLAEHKDEEFEIEDEGEPEVIDEYATKDRHGKPIMNPRYQRHEYGFTQTVTVRCVHCNATKEVGLTDRVAASAFESLT